MVSLKCQTLEHPLDTDPCLDQMLEKRTLNTYPNKIYNMTTKNSFFLITRADFMHLQVFINCPKNLLQV